MVQALLFSILRARYNPLIAQKGIWGGEKIVSGHYTTKKRKHKIKRKWYPNVQRMKVFSDILNHTFRVPATMSAIKQIERAGSFDNYILRTPESKLDSRLALEFRKKILSRVIYLKQRNINQDRKNIYHLKGLQAEHFTKINEGRQKIGSEAFEMHRAKANKLRHQINMLKKQIDIYEWELLDAKRRSVTQREKYLRNKAYKVQLKNIEKNRKKLAAKASATDIQDDDDDDDEEDVETERKGFFDRIKSFFSRR